MDKYKLSFEVVGNKENSKNLEIEIAQYFLEKERKKITENKKLTAEEKEVQIKEKEEEFEKKVLNITNVLFNLNVKEEKNEKDNEDEIEENEEKSKTKTKHFGFGVLSSSTIEGFILRLTGGYKKLSQLKEDDFYSSILSMFKNLSYSYKEKDVAHHFMTKNHTELVGSNQSKSIKGIYKQNDNLFWFFDVNSSLHKFFNPYFYFCENFNKDSEEHKKILLNLHLSILKLNEEEIRNVQVDNFLKEIKEFSKDKKCNLSYLEILDNFELNKKDDLYQKLVSIENNLIEEKTLLEVYLNNLKKHFNKNNKKFETQITAKNTSKKEKIYNHFSFIFLQLLRLKYLEDQSKSNEDVFLNYFQTDNGKVSLNGGIAPLSGGISFGLASGKENIVKFRRSSPFKIKQTNGVMEVFFEMEKENMVFIKKLLKLYSFNQLPFGNSGIAKNIKLEQI